MYSSRELQQFNKVVSNSRKTKSNFVKLWMKTFFFNRNLLKKCVFKMSESSIFIQNYQRIVILFNVVNVIIHHPMCTLMLILSLLHATNRLCT